MKQNTFKGILVAAIALAAMWSSNATAGGPGYCYDPATRDGYVCTRTDCAGDAHVAKKDGTCATCGAQLVARKDLTYVAIVVHDGVEPLDFSGPAEVFTSAGRFYVYTVSPNGRAITSRGSLALQPDYSMQNCPWPDVLVVPGGQSNVLTGDELSMHWIKSVSAQTDVVMSVSSGAFVLANAGLLEGREATAHATDIDGLKRAAPRTKVHADTRFVDNGTVITTAGVSSGIDGALRVVQRIYGDDAARKTANALEYDGWSPEGGVIVSARK